LNEPRGRRSALRDVETCVRRGWLDVAGPQHQALTTALWRLIDDAQVAPRERLRALRILIVGITGERTDRPSRLFPLTEQRERRKEIA
jgi:hypothetical protein